MFHQGPMLLHILISSNIVVSNQSLLAISFYLIIQIMLAGKFSGKYFWLNITLVWSITERSVTTSQLCYRRSLLSSPGAGPPPALWRSKTKTVRWGTLVIRLIVNTYTKPGQAAFRVASVVTLGIDEPTNQPDSPGN